MKERKRTYLRENMIAFRPSPQCMRELQEMWEDWGESRTEVILRAVHTTYLLWKNGWLTSLNLEAPEQEYTPEQVAEE